MAQPSEESLLAWDRDHLWHPYASMTEPGPARLVTGASGVRLTLGDGRQVVDAMASWWAAIHGYRHPVLDDAVRRQLDRMAHVMFGGLTHEPAVRLGRALLDLAPAGLAHVFFSDSGSVSVEVALKMAVQFQRGAGRPDRTRMLTVLGGYHGDTCGCMGVCDPDGGMHSMFRDSLSGHVFAPRPPALGEDVEPWARAFRRLAETHSGSLAGIIVEPLLQGAGGMWPYPAECLVVMREVADEHGLLLVLDEIATGFGRTGTMFAADAAGVSPDVMCVGKALTGGYLSLGATLATARVAQGIARSESGVLMHGPTFMANPLACAVAAASLDLLTSTDWAGQVSRINARLTAGLAPALDLPGVKDVRTLGAVGVVQLAAPLTPATAAAATDAALDAGVWIRPFRDLVYTMPPYVCEDDDVALVCAGLLAATRAARC